MIKPQELAQKIAGFLDKYAGRKPDFDPQFDDESERFTSPDASILFEAGKMLSKFPALPEDFAIFSSWESGGYAPYQDKEGKALHDEIVQQCNAMKKPRSGEIFKFLERWQLKPIHAAKVLKIQSSKMYEYMSGTSDRLLPDYIAAHIETFNQLSASEAKKLIEKRLNKEKSPKKRS